MDRRTRSTRMGFACALAALALAAPAAVLRSNLRARLLPDMFTHLSHAQAEVDAGRPQAATAHADVVLLPGTMKVFARFDGISKGRQAGCLAALRRGMDSWKSALDGETGFALVEDEAAADVHVSFVPHLTLDGRAVGGHTAWRRCVRSDSNGDWTGRFTATVQLAADQPNGRAMTGDQMCDAAAHEFGHILGMQDSARQGDVMGPLCLGRPVIAPQAEELEALVELRDEARRLRVRALAMMP